MKIGIPRALYYYKHPELWKTFFEFLGYETVISPKTNKEILNKGVKVSESESCFSIKIFNGHVADIKDKADYIFIPRIRSLRKRYVNCPKFLALSDSTRAIFKGTRFLSTNIDLNRIGIKNSLFRLGFKLTKNPFRILNATKKAIKAEKNHKKELHQVFDKKIKSKNKKIVLISHPYNLYDNFINLNIIKKLESLGAEVITIDTVPFKHEKTELHWDFANDILNSVDYIKDKNIQGVVQLTTFNCGCDSIIKELVEERFSKSKIPYMSIIVDEHTGEAGIITRLEAFVDSLTW